MFFGTPKWAVPSLTALLRSEIEVAAVVTNPDRIAGRGLQPRPSPVKLAAEAAGLQVFQPTRARDPGLRERLREIAPEVACVVAYGKILPAELLTLPALGFVNAHFSLLPAYRGAAPVQWALINGDAMTGISIMVLTEGMDEGPLLATETAAIHPSDTAASLGERLANRAARLLVESVMRFAEGILTPVPQSTEGVSYAPKLTSGDARVDWSASAPAISHLIRGANPEPGAWTTFRGNRVKLLRALPLAEERALPPGRIRLGSDGLIVGCGGGNLLVTAAQLAGKRALRGAEFGRGLRLQQDDHFD